MTRPVDRARAALAEEAHGRRVYELRVAAARIAAATALPAAARRTMLAELEELLAEELEHGLARAMREARALGADA